MTTKTALTSNVIKTYQQFDNLDFQDGYEWNDEASYGENLCAAIESLESHNNVVLSGDALRAANNPKLMSILPSNRGMLLWMYFNALDTSEVLDEEWRMLTTGADEGFLWKPAANTTQKWHDDKALLKNKRSDNRMLVEALEATLTRTELKKMRAYRTDNENGPLAFAIFIGFIACILGLLVDPTPKGYDPMNDPYATAASIAGAGISVIIIKLMCGLMGALVGTVVSYWPLTRLQKVMDKGLMKRRTHFITAEDAEYLDWDVPGLVWDDALTDTENKEAIVKAIETHNQVILVVDALVAVQKEAKAYYSPTPVKRIPRKAKAYGQTKARKGRNTAITIVCHTH